MRVHRNGAWGRRKGAEAAAFDCAGALQKIALDAVGAIKAQHAGACGGDAEAVHQVRVAITRLRAAVAFFGPVLPDAEWPRLKRQIAWLNDPLGAARDSDVALEYARRAKYRAWALAVIGDQLERRQRLDHRHLVRCLRSARTKRLIADLTRWAKQGAWLKRHRRRKDLEALPDYCAEELKRWHARLIVKGKRLDDLGSARRHRLRIRVKRFRYMLEALTETVPLWSRRDVARLHRPAKRLQRALGDMRDLRRLAGLAGDGSRPPDYRHQRNKLRDDAIAAYRDLKDAKTR